MFLGRTMSSIVPAPGKDPNLEGHHDAHELSTVLQVLHARHPELTELEWVGQTHEQRPILALRICDDAGDAGLEDPDVLLLGGTHGCEPAAVETVLRITAFLLEAHDEIHDVIADRNIWVLPLHNPDGLAYFYGSGPIFFRKNRRAVSGARWSVTGVDPNRNFPTGWGYTNSGSSPDPESMMYRGAAPISEPETRTLHDLVMRRDFRISLAFHTFGSQYIYPWNYEFMDPPGVAFYATFCGAAANWSGYTYGNPRKGLIPVHGRLPNGDFDDWMQSTAAGPDQSLYKDPCHALTVEVGPSIAAVYLRPPDIHGYFVETLVPVLCAIEIADDPPGKVANAAERMERIGERVERIFEKHADGSLWVENLFRSGGEIHDAVDRWEEDGVDGGKR